MKLNQWTLGLAAVGVVNLAAVLHADDAAKMNVLQTALSTTTISGYVDTSIEWGLDNKRTFSIGNIQDGIPFQAGKRDGFNLDVVKLTIEKPLDESEWAAGYKVDLLFGPDANGLATGSPSSGDNGFENSDFGIKNAYVALRTPIGNGIDWKIGVYDTVIGYETFEAGNNPNFTRSWGYAVEPTEHTGILGSYRFCEYFSVSAGVANTLSANINDRPFSEAEAWHKTFLGSIALTAPQDWGFIGGSTLYAGTVIGINNAGGSFVGFGNNDQGNYYAGLTLNTPLTGLKAGVAFDYVHDLGGSQFDAWVLGAYLSYQVTEKLSVHARGEYGEFEGAGLQADSKVQLTSLTGTAQYDLWKNVISRVEIRWDQAYDRNGLDLDGGGIFTRYANTGLALYANLIYKF